MDGRLVRLDGGTISLDQRFGRAIAAVRAAWAVVTVRWSGQPLSRSRRTVVVLDGGLVRLDGGQVSGDQGEGGCIDRGWIRGKRWDVPLNAEAKRTTSVGIRAARDD